MAGGGRARHRTRCRRRGPQRSSCSRSALACVSAIHSCDRRHTQPPCRSTALPPTWRWRRQRTRDTDPERRAWHLGAAATGPDEDVASELERTAGRVQARAGLAAAAAFLQRSVELTADAGLRTDRALAAAQAHMHAGAYDTARGLLAEAAAVAVDDLQRARVEQLNGQIEAAASPGREAPVRLLHAALRLEPLDVPLARDTYLQAWWAAVLAADFAAPGGGLAEISRAVRSAPRAAEPRVCDLLLDGLATAITDGRDAAAPGLRRAIDLLPHRSGLRRRLDPVGPERDDGRLRPVGRRQLGRAERPSGRPGSLVRRTRAARARPQLPRVHDDLLWRSGGRHGIRRRADRRQRCNGHPNHVLRRSAPRRLPRSPDRHSAAGGDDRRTRSPAVGTATPTCRAA